MCYSHMLLLQKERISGMIRQLEVSTTASDFTVFDLSWEKGLKKENNSRKVWWEIETLITLVAKERERKKALNSYFTPQTSDEGSSRNHDFYSEGRRSLF